ncbi:MAG: hypothetical protein ACPGQS_02525 [Bradymonadia bacterium]
MVGLLVSSAVASEAPAETATTSEQPESEQTEAKATPETHQTIHRAKQLIKDGEFAAAHALLTELLKSDAHRTETLLVLHELSQYWTTQGLVLTKTAQPVQSKPAQALNAASAPPTESEIASLYIDSVVYGFASGAVWFGGVFEIDSVAGVVMPSLALAGAASYGVYRLNTDGYLSRGMPRTISLGLRLGFVESALLSSYIGSEFNNVHPKALLIGGFAGTTLGGLAGGLLARSRPISPARASLMESTALWGGVLATMAHEAISNGNSSNEILLTSSTGVLGGAIAGSFIGDDTTLTESRVRYLDLGGLTGALVAGGIYASFEPKDAPAYLTQGIIASGIAAGWYTAFRLTRGEGAQARVRSNASPHRLAAMKTPDGNWLLTSWGTF